MSCSCRVASESIAILGLVLLCKPLPGTVAQLWQIHAVSLGYAVFPVIRPVRVVFTHSPVSIDPDLKTMGCVRWKLFPSNVSKIREKGKNKEKVCQKLCGFLALAGCVETAASNRHAGGVRSKGRDVGRSQ